MKNIKWFKKMQKFLILWSSQSISSLGSSITSFALILWVYQQQETASSITLLSFFTFLPSILFCFIAGAIADKWDKKRIMLISDFVAAMGTVIVLVLFSTNNLDIWHLYLVNFMISFMNAFQKPAAYVATSLLVPKDQLVRASGLQVFSSSIVSILTPAIATSLMAFGGLKVVLILDLVTFVVAFLILLIYITLPIIEENRKSVKQSFLKSSTEGLRFLMEHKGLLHIILFFSFVNLMAYITGFGIMPAFILARSGNDQVVLGLVSSSLGIGTLVGSMLVTGMKPAKNRIRVVFLSCAISFALCNLIIAIGRTAPYWIFAAFAGNLPLPFLNANLSTIMRIHVPIEMQGRVFSTRDTLQYSTIPLGLFLGGYLADYVFEPFMKSKSHLQGFLSFFVGEGKGSGMAIMFLITGVVGSVSCLLSLKNPSYKELEERESK